MKHPADKYNYVMEIPLALAMALVFILSVSCGQPMQATPVTVIAPKEKRKKEMDPEDSKVLAGLIKRATALWGIGRDHERIVFQNLQSQMDSLALNNN